MWVCVEGQGEGVGYRIGERVLAGGGTFRVLALKLEPTHTGAHEKKERGRRAPGALSHTPPPTLQREKTETRAANQTAYKNNKLTHLLSHADAQDRWCVCGEGVECVHPQRNVKPVNRRGATRDQGEREGEGRGMQTTSACERGTQRHGGVGRVVVGGGVCVFVGGLVPEREQREMSTPKPKRELASKMKRRQA